jgi:hypothetical protein
LLCKGERTVASVLRILGKQEEKRFEKYHRVLNRDRWSCLAMGRILLGLIIALVPKDFPLIVLVDETLERRKGQRIWAKGYYRDAVRSSQKTVVKCMGLKWISMMLLVPLPWNKRPWALPFLTLLAPSERANQERGRTHKTTVDWTCTMVRLVSRWVKRAWILVGDGAYACIELGHHCARLNVTLISRLRLDANLYEAPPIVPQGRRGRKPIKGAKMLSLKDQANDPNRTWVERSIRWYGGEKKIVRILTGKNLWYKSGEKPLWIRWVLVLNPDKPNKPEAFFSTQTTLSTTHIIECFVARWNVEVTFEEVRAHLGVETQRQWSDRAISCTTPLLMGLYSIVCLIAHHLQQTVRLIPAQAAWYNKGDQITFSDLLALVRRNILIKKYFYNSPHTIDPNKLPPPLYNSLLYLLTQTT